jgi:hypothetical protein
MAINPLVFPDLPYDPQKGFRTAGPRHLDSRGADGQQGRAGNVRCRADRTRQERARQAHYATGGSATLLSLELFKAMADLDIRSIPYRGGAPAVTATIGGERPAKPG